MTFAYDYFILCGKYITLLSHCMCTLHDALFSGPHQDHIIQLFATHIHTTPESKCQSAIFDTRVSDVEPRPEKDRIAGFYQQVAQYGNALTKTFAVLAAMYVVPSILESIQAHTPVSISRAFLNGFCSRFETHLCGTATRANKLPVEIVLFEWQLYTKLAT